MVETQVQEEKLYQFTVECNCTQHSLDQLSVMKPTIKQYDVFLLAKDLNPIIREGMQGVILEIWDDNNFEIEFVKDEGTNYEYNGKATFTVDKSFIGELVWPTTTYN